MEHWIQRNAWLQRGVVWSVLALLGIMTAFPAHAIPPFARQTGMACNACHVVYPELTHFGRMFKINGYQLFNGKELQYAEDDGELRLGLPAIPNLALFIMAGYVSLGKAVPDSAVLGAHSTSSGIQFPQQVSLLWGGKITPHVGAFAQVTYDSTGNSFSIDNTDVRGAWQFVLPDKTPLTLGVSVNNNPTVVARYSARGRARGRCEPAPRARSYDRARTARLVARGMWPYRGRQAQSSAHARAQRPPRRSRAAVSQRPGRTRR
jgi:hypothetical protein